MIKAVLFDLDDTLYLEADFFRSGFMRVAHELEARGVGECTAIAALLERIRQTEGRDRVFNKASTLLGFPEAWVPQLVDVFRGHSPRISPAPEVPGILRELRQRYALGCVTDGIGEVQRRKISALRIADLLDSIVIADDFGRNHWKPDPLPFQVCCSQLGVQARETVFVGDNPERDIRGANNLGMVSVRVTRPEGWFRDLAPRAGEEPDFLIRDLTELHRVLELLGA